MKTIQVVLLAGSCAFLVMYFRRLRSKLLDRIIVVALVAVGAYFVIDPAVCTAVANVFGVGRGADLVFYLGLALLGFMALLLYTKQRNVESRVTRLVRAISLIHAQAPEKHSVNQDRPFPHTVPILPATPRTRAG